MRQTLSTRGNVPVWNRDSYGRVGIARHESAKLGNSLRQRAACESSIAACAQCRNSPRVFSSWKLPHAQLLCSRWFVKKPGGEVVRCSFQIHSPGPGCPFLHPQYCVSPPTQIPRPRGTQTPKHNCPPSSNQLANQPSDLHPSPEPLPPNFFQVVAQNIVDMARDGDGLGVVDFDGTAKPLHKLVTVTEATRVSMKNSITELDEAGSTNIKAGLVEAASLLTASTSNNPKVVILLSDGLDTTNTIDSFDGLLDKCVHSLEFPFPLPVSPALLLLQVE